MNPSFYKRLFHTALFTPIFSLLAGGLCLFVPAVQAVVLSQVIWLAPATLAASVLLGACYQALEPRAYMFGGRGKGASLGGLMAAVLGFFLFSEMTKPGVGGFDTVVSQAIHSTMLMVAGGASLLVFFLVRWLVARKADSDLTAGWLVRDKAAAIGELKAALAQTPYKASAAQIVAYAEKLDGADAVRDLTDALKGKAAADTKHAALKALTS